MDAVLRVTPLSLVFSVLVLLLGTVIGAFSLRYLQGEAGRGRYLAWLSVLLAAVQLLLLADHWLLLIAAWAAVGAALQPLLCFYPERPFAQLAAHKKWLADRVADLLLLAAAALAWREVGSGSLSALSAHLAAHGMSPSLHWCAAALVLAVALRAASLPVHGWLIQVMEAPTPVSALLHAGVVNLGGMVLLRFAPLLEQALPARALLLALGLGSAVLAGMVMLTRVSIKVRLAWSTVAQMGFMLAECALGLYTLAALHLVGHSLYKAHAFLSASDAVRQTRLQALHGDSAPSTTSLVLAPLAAGVMVWLVQTLLGVPAWPWWWASILSLAWAPMLWLRPAAIRTATSRPAPGAVKFAVAADAGDIEGTARVLMAQAGFGLALVAGLTLAALAGHALPLGLHDAPNDRLGQCALAGMAALYLMQMLLQRRPQLVARWRRWSYAGFYVDEAYTRLALRIWPVRWAPQAEA